MFFLEFFNIFDLLVTTGKLYNLKLIPKDFQNIRNQNISWWTTSIIHMSHSMKYYSSEF